MKRLRQTAIAAAFYTKLNRIIGLLENELADIENGGDMPEHLVAYQELIREFDKMRYNPMGDYTRVQASENVPGVQIAEYKTSKEDGDETD